VITNAGGPGILAADALASEGLELPEFSDGLKERLREHLSAEASVANPVDMIASAGPEEYRACLQELAASDEIDAVIVIFIPTTPEGTASVEPVIREVVASRENEKTMLTVFMEADSADRPKRPSGEPRIPTYPFPEPAARALARSVRYAEWRAKPAGEVVEFDDTDSEAAQDAIWEALSRLGSDGGWLEPDEAERVLDAFGVARAGSAVATSRDEAITAAAEIGGPVVLKVLAPSALHKSDVGGIVLGVEGDEAVGEAFDEVMAAADDATGALVQEFVKDGHEVLVGMTEDPSFGPLVAFGLGGVFVELIGDVSFRIHPLTDVDADEMIADVKSAKLLEGYRGGPAGDVDALKEMLLRLSRLIDQVPEIAEFDLNPVKVLEPGQGVRVVDMRIRVRPVPQRWLPSRKDIPAAERRLR
jgi:acyl-CoA synthetase (NDP forming)